MNKEIRNLIITITDYEENINFSCISEKGYFKDHELIGLLEMLKNKLLLLKDCNWEKTDKKGINYNKV